MSCPIDGKVSADGIRDCLGTFGRREHGISIGDFVIETIQEMACKMKKSEREFLHKSQILNQEHCCG
jgi:hypothetical protein